MAALDDAADRRKQHRENLVATVVLLIMWPLLFAEAGWHQGVVFWIADLALLAILVITGIQWLVLARRHPRTTTRRARTLRLLLAGALLLILVVATIIRLVA